VSTALERTIIALDNFTLDEGKSFLKQQGQYFKTIKIGMQLYYAHGPQVIHELSKEFAGDIFLDLKLHDIPQTVSKAIESLDGLPIKFLTVHASGGEKMLVAAREAQKKHLPNTQLLAVTYLTSLELNDVQQLWDLDSQSWKKSFLSMLAICQKSDITGLVCSANDLKTINSYDFPFIKVCPGIRFPDEISAGELQDQKRVLDPSSALNSHCDYLVIGRSLTQSKDLGARVKELSEITSF
jgi:orotidine-5'-phosphate decarboxylase